jgi:hypothetical protein
VDATALRDLQAPLKQRYRDDPGTARAPMHAEAEYADPGITCTVQTWAGPVRAGLHPYTGGDVTERYCVVAQTLARPPHLEVRRAVPAEGQVVAR